MSIISALKQQNNSIDDLAKLPQAAIMQMVQHKQIDETMLAPILARKAELADAFARDKALQGANQPKPTVMEQLMAKNAEDENPMPEQPMPQQMPQMMAQAPQGFEQTGVGQLPIPERAYAGGGIIAFDDGGEVDDEDPYEERVRQSRMQGFGTPVEDLYAMMKRGIGSARNIMPESYEKAKQQASTGEVSNADQARKFNVGNLRPSGFSYPGQVGVSKGGFAMFDSPEAGIKALQHDISIKLNRGLDTPQKFISVYAPESDKNDVKTYSKNVANMLGIGPNDRIPNTPQAKQLLASAIVRQEGAHKATAAFAHGGEVRHFYEGDYVDPMGSAPVITDPEMGSYKSIVPGSPENLLANKQITPEQYKEIKTKQEAAKAPVEKPKQESKPDLQTTFEDFTRRQQSNPERDIFAEMIARNMAQREDIKKSAAEDRNLALLAAGLGMMGGTSPYAFANMGQGALKGVEYLGASKAKRAAELNALNKADTEATYYGAETTRKNQTLRSLESERAIDNLASYDAKLRKNYFMEGVAPTPKQLEAYEAARRSDPIYNRLSRDAGVYGSTPAAPVLNYNPKTRSLG